MQSSTTFVTGSVAGSVARTSQTHSKAAVPVAEGSSSHQRRSPDGRRSENTGLKEAFHKATTSGKKAIAPQEPGSARSQSESSSPEHKKTDAYRRLFERSFHVKNRLLRLLEVPLQSLESPRILPQGVLGIVKVCFES